MNKSDLENLILKIDLLSYKFDLVTITYKYHNNSDILNIFHNNCEAKIKYSPIDKSVYDNTDSYVLILHYRNIRDILLNIEEPILKTIRLVYYKVDVDKTYIIMYSYDGTKILVIDLFSWTFMFMIRIESLFYKNKNEELKKFVKNLVGLNPLPKSIDYENESSS